MRSFDLITLLAPQVLPAKSRAKVAAKLLSNAGVDINSAANGVFLGRKYHKIIHTDRYYDKLERMLLNSDRSRPGVLKVLAEIKSQLQSRTF